MAKVDEEFGALDQLYQEIILDHYRKPRNFAEIDAADAQVEHENPFCGDQIKMHIEVQDGKLQDIKFYGHGCAISQASASMMTEVVKGKPVPEVERMIATFKAFMRSEVELPEEFGDVIVLEGVRQFPVRIKCAELGWHALETCLRNLRFLEVKVTTAEGNKETGEVEGAQGAPHCTIQMP